MLTVVVDAILPVFALIFLGYVCARTDLLGEAAFEVLNRLVLRLSLPALTFYILAKVAPGDLAAPGMIAAVLGGAASVYAISFLWDRWLGRPAGDANIIALSASYANTAFVGIPICLVALGPESLAPAALITAINASIVFGFGLVMSELLASRDETLAHALASAGKAVCRNPLILSSVLGVGWSLLRLPLPTALDTFAKTLGAATAPCALITIGLFIARAPTHEDPLTIGRSLALKLAGQPMATMALLLVIPGVSAVGGKTAVLLAAMPTATSSFMLASGFSPTALNACARVIVLSTALALVTLVAMLAFLGHAQSL